MRKNESVRHETAADPRVNAIAAAAAGTPMYPSDKYIDTLIEVVGRMVQDEKRKGNS